MAPSFAWKLVLAVALLATIVASARARAPRRSFPRADLRLLVGAALLLYTVGLAASLSHRGTLAAALYAAGIGMSAFASWLSRGHDGGGLAAPDDVVEDPDPPSPDASPSFDWRAFEKEFWAYEDRRRGERTPVG